jgi:hypothetical protein
MAKKSAKEIAQRIDPEYFKAPHPFRTWMRRASWAGFLGGALFAGVTAFAGNGRALMNGPLSRAHALFAADCSKCHTEAFGATRDASCLACHEGPPHAPPEKAVDPACATCHAEHRGREALAFVRDAACNACHEHHAGVRDLAGHVPFRIEPRDQAIRFSHAAHLKPDLKDGPLACADCHRLDAAGRAFRPIAFEADCARCHPLGFDVAHPEARVPHGLGVSELKLRLDAFYLNALRADPALARKTGRGSPVPGRALPPPPGWEAAIAAQTEAALRVLFAPGAGCLYCHVAGEGGGIHPPSIPVDWMEAARFSHATHRFERCESCHDVARVETAEVVALPRIERCRECHAPGGARTDCAACHHYHRR